MGSNDRGKSGRRHSDVFFKVGWANPSELKESDFDPLRGRADFRKLVAEVEAKKSGKAGGGGEEVSSIEAMAGKHFQDIPPGTFNSILRQAGF